MSSFLKEKRALRPSQALNAITNPVKDTRRFRHDPEYEEKAQRNARKESTISFEQGQGMQIFVHQRRLFWVQRMDGEGHSYYGNRYKKQELLKFSCLGRSVSPIKELMEEVYKMNKEKEKSLTVIRRPYGSGHGSRLTWSRLTAKRRRQLDTVILQESQTSTIIADVEEYMSEATRIFYANHGIPYRRGYLFHGESHRVLNGSRTDFLGPPGCGKTSFCLALASKFDLDVYILTLMDKDITDTDLMSLLNQLPTPSLLLLEDIDEAGLNRKSKTYASQRSRKNKNLPEGAVDVDDTYESEEEDNRPKTQVTLSGLLNAIDGVAAPEGHILIMTTNKPEELDDALVRAGRISVHVKFSNANKKQAEQIFQRMYVDLEVASTTLTTTATTTTTTTTTTPPTEETRTNPEKQTNLDTLAQQFASLIPNEQYSPADLQDYLLIHKKSPESAVTNLPKWMNDKKEERNRKEEEKEAAIRWKIERAEERRKKWRDDLKKAISEGGEEKGLELIESKEMELDGREKDGDKDKDKNIKEWDGDLGKKRKGRRS